VGDLYLYLLLDKENQENLRQDGWVSAKSYMKYSSYIILSKISPIIITDRPKLLTYKNMFMCDISLGAGIFF